MHMVGGFLLNVTAAAIEQFSWSQFIRVIILGMVAGFSFVVVESLVISISAILEAATKRTDGLRYCRRCAKGTATSAWKAWRCSECGCTTWAEQSNGSEEEEEDATRLCLLCCDAKVSEHDAGERTSERCRHARGVCDDCLARHVAEEVRGKGNHTSITCPEPDCKEAMEHHKVQRWAIASVFEAYDQLLLRDCLQKDEEFRWCAWRGCGSGQKHPGTDRTPIMSCYRCRRKTCFTHRCEWHENRTCSQYDQDAEQNEEVALLQALESGGAIKKCPKCGQGIEKNDGCDHMTCRKPGGCGFEFCWRCLAPYDGADGIRQKGNTAHKPSCLFHM